MAWTSAQLPDLTGRIAVVTGANSGIGAHTARELVEHGAEVILACRNTAAGGSTAAKLGPHAHVFPLDLASMASVREFGEMWDGPLDLLVNNAGVMAPPKARTTADGFELQFGTNHLGHFVLTGLLLPALAASGAGRVVTVGSIAHHNGTEAVLDGNVGEAYDPLRTYSNSKLANLLFAAELDRRLGADEAPITSTAAHPGVAATNLFTSREGMGSRVALRLLGPVFLNVFTQPARVAARASLYAATDGAPGSYTGPRRFGETRGPIGTAKRSRLAQSTDLAKRLWRVSEELTGFRYDWDALAPAGTAEPAVDTPKPAGSGGPTGAPGAAAAP